MKQNINFSQFVDAFSNYGRSNQFSYDGLRALYDYLEQYEEDTGEEVELDVIALCCEFSEYSSLVDVAENYSPTLTMYECPDCEQETEYDESGICEHCGEGIFNQDFEDDRDEEIREYLHNNTNFIEFSGGVIVLDF